MILLRDPILRTILLMALLLSASALAGFPDHGVPWPGMTTPPDAPQSTASMTPQQLRERVIVLEQRLREYEVREAENIRKVRMATRAQIKLEN